MKFLKDNILSIANSFLILGLLALLLSNNNASKKTVFINNTKVFNEFSMTRDMLKINQKKIDLKKNRLDSLIVEIRNLKVKINDKATLSDNKLLSKMQNSALLQDKKIKELQENITNEITVSVWKRLNEYVKKFGKEYNFELILGTQGRGNIMYARDEIDITDQFLEYANEKYEGN